MVTHPLTTDWLQGEEKDSSPGKKKNKSKDKLSINQLGSKMVEQLATAFCRIRTVVMDQAFKYLHG